MGAAPSISELYFQYGLKMLLIYCFGAAFTPFYRLVGPYKSASAPAIIKGEILDVILRRGVIGNLTMGLIPMIFYGLISAVALCLEIVWRALRLVGVDVPLPAAIQGKKVVKANM
jgi:dimethylaniline monooxygenase (N-oxide forming)